jgi:hypothetical protein
MGRTARGQWLMPAVLATGGRDQEDYGSKPTQANSSQHPILKKPITHKKKAGGVAQGVGPEFKPQYWGGGKKRQNWFLLKFLQNGVSPT